MDCDFSSAEMKCPQCGFIAGTRRLRIPCRLPAEIKRKANEIAVRHADVTVAPAAIPPPQANGPGTELHALLGRLGITATADCKCASRAAYLDGMGCDWAEHNIEEIVGWLRESAAERGLPFVDMAGRLLVRRAIHNARRKEAARGTEDRPPLHAER